ncbi:unnamed protein product [Clonostachys rosea]|uniref:Putative gamma-glutamylcyclotransferase n=1 Tax=Bionectria ochroleuca TaxID=29856 RepID=A0ABY6UMM7_BIOOC|nr:unnamed protein product [Clonostachys rosea]
MSTQKPDPIPLFVYGSLCAVPLLAWALTGDSSNTSAVEYLIRPARVYGFSRYALSGRDYPAAVDSQESNSTIDGYLINFETRSQRRKLDDFEGETYIASPVQAHILSVAGGRPTGEVVDGEIYLWQGPRDDLLLEGWDLKKFIQERLQDWLDLFEGIELVGEDDEDGVAQGAIRARHDYVMGRWHRKDNEGQTGMHWKKKKLAENNFWEPAPHPFVWIGTRKFGNSGLRMSPGGETKPLDNLPPRESSKVYKYPMVWLNPVTGKRNFMVLPDVVARLYKKK